LNLDLNASKYLNWNEIKANLSWKVKKCKDRLTQIYQILNKVQKTLNSIKEIEISHFKKSWDQEIEHLAKLQTEFAKDKTDDTINTHYRKLERIIKKTKNIMMYIDASINNEIYLYKMLTTNLLQAMLVRRAEQSHQHWQSSNSALFTCWAHTQSKSETITTQSSMHWSLHIHRRTATSLHTCCNSYMTYTYILRRHDSAFAHIHICATQQIDQFRFSDWFTCVANTYTAKTWHSLCSHTQNNSNVFAHALQLIYITHTYIAKTWLSFCTSTRLQNAVNWSIFRIIRSIYMHRNHIHCEDMTQSLLIYTEQQQRLCAHAATHIHHTYIHCKDTTQLLHIYTLMWCSKSIDFSLYQINVHASQSHTLQRHDTVFAHIHRTTATSLRTCCNSYTSHTYTLRRHDSAFAHLHAHMMQ